jgi:hypothetical protein
MSLSKELYGRLKGQPTDYEIWRYKKPNEKEIAAAARQSRFNIRHIKAIAIHKQNGPEKNLKKKKYVFSVAYHGLADWYEEPVIDYLGKHHLPSVHNWLQLRLPGFSSELRDVFIEKSRKIPSSALRYVRVSNCF